MNVPRRPNFLVIGAMKGGTGAIYEYLRAHPQIYMAETKELHFFSGPPNWDRGLTWYEEQFAAAGSARAVGEASPRYTWSPLCPGVPERIARVIPDVRLVYVLRQPVDRIQSHYLHAIRKGTERRPPDEAVLEDPAYMVPSRYGHQIDRYLEWFSREQLLVATSEDLRHRRRDTLQRVFRFLEVDADMIPETIESEFHRAADKRVARRPLRSLRSTAPIRALVRQSPTTLRKFASRLTTERADSDANLMSATTRSELTDRLRSDVRRLREILGDDFDAWGIA